VTTPTQVPDTLTAGDLWEWTRDVSADYPAGTWSGAWYFENAWRNFSVTASAIGTVFAASVAASTTAAYRPGKYTWRLVVTNGSIRKTVDSGELTLEVDPAAAGSVDRRSHEVRVLEAIEATIEGAASTDQQAMTIAGRSLQRRTLSELTALRKEYLILVQRQQGKSQRIGVRFGSA
jgi:hypothetical protein